MLQLACDRKVRFYSTHANSYGLNAGPPELNGTCPGCTKDKGGCFHIPEGKKNPTCYAYCLAKCFKGAGRVLNENTEKLKGTQAEIRKELVDTFESFRKTTRAWCEKNGEETWLPYAYFRLHWSGDVFSLEYAKALVSAMKAFPDIRFWTYTRSFQYVDVLMKAPNLILYLSADRPNFKEAWECFKKNKMYADKRYKIAYMGKELEEFETKVEDLKRTEKNAKIKDWLDKASITLCPVDAGRMDLEGGCSKCRQCITEGHQLLFFKC